MDNYTKKLLGLEDKNILFEKDGLEERKEKDYQVNIIKGKLSYTPSCCEKCGVKNNGQIIKNGTHTTKTQLPSFNRKITFLELKRIRFYCSECQCTFNAKTTIVDEGAHLSKHLKYSIALDLKYNSSRKQIA